MSAIVVWLSLVLGVGFALAYFLIPRLRREIESPKYVFQKQLQQYHTQQSKQAFLKESSNESE